MADWYVANDGTGDGTSVGVPDTLADIWASVNPGDTVYMADGTYQGANNMISPYQQGFSGGLHGFDGSPITVSAINDGAVTIDGQGVRWPIYLRENDWWIVEGVNAKNSSGSATRFFNCTDSIIRRVCGWDNLIDSNDGIMTAGGTSLRCLYEDCAAFGRGRKCFETAFSGNSFTTFRRCWARWQGCTYVGPKMCFSMHYNSYNTTIENCLATWSNESMPETYTLVCPPELTTYGPCGQTHSNYAVDQGYGYFTIDAASQTAVNVKLLGSIAYGTSVDNYKGTWGILTSPLNDEYEIKDVVIYSGPGMSTTHKSWQLDSGASTNGLSFTNSTSIGSPNANTVGIGYSTANIEQEATVGAAASIWSSAVGAQVCKRYVDGTLTGDTLWPWPMDARIKAALTAAGYTSVTNGMANDSGLVTDAMEQIFGTIDSACYTPTGPLAPITVDDADVTNINVAVAINVLANDDANGQTIDAATVMASVPPNGAVVVHPTTGVCTYTPDTDFVGEDTFTYTVDDSDGDTSSPATVTVTVMALPIDVPPESEIISVLIRRRRHGR